MTFAQSYAQLQRIKARRRDARRRTRMVCVDRYRAGESAADLAVDYDVTHQTVYAWIKSFNVRKQNHSTHLKDTDIPIIRSRRAAGETFQKLATDYNVSRTAIQLIVYRKTWKHVP